MQQELFPTDRQEPDRPPVLSRLNPEDRQNLVKALARLLVETLRPPRKECER